MFFLSLMEHTLQLRPHLLDLPLNEAVKGEFETKIDNFERIRPQELNEQNIEALVAENNLSFLSFTSGSLTMIFIDTLLKLGILFPMKIDKKSTTISSTKTQAWLDNATAIMEMMCGSYVHISRLIWDLKNSERKERISMQRNQLRTDEESKEVVSLGGNNPSGLRNGLNGVVSANSIGGSAMEKNSIEARKGSPGNNLTPVDPCHYERNNSNVDAQLDLILFGCVSR
ncbi:hypothetical protein PVL29_009278 [Vitis rotundifolia]|uniref:Uncharacterized protein n=1 Tax=Vitis rotundifolia TaxID=103349 RepID=A0AA38ZYQ9_VITRO|nr:hypothetical protein PVL29_009278 [Vitis rotundifolia]